MWDILEFVLCPLLELFAWVCHVDGRSHVRYLSVGCGVVVVVIGILLVVLAR